MDLTPLLLTGVLAAGLVVQLALPASTMSAPAYRSRTVAFHEIILPEPVAAYPDIVQHALFNAARAASENGATGQSAPVGAFMLMGVASTGHSASAILRDEAGVLHSVTLGQNLDGWRLAAVSPDGAIVVRGSLSQTLKVGAAPAAVSKPQVVSR